jgi:hypothetical protein
MAQRVFSRRTDGLGMTFQSGQVRNVIHSVGYRLWMWSVLGLPPNAVTKGMVWWMASAQQQDGHWRTQNTRTPLEEGDLHATALGIRSLAMFPLEGRKQEFAERIARAAAWLRDTPARTHTDAAFRLLGLAWAGDTPATLERERESLVVSQRPDGGWAQLPGMPSDAWATGLSLMALHACGLEPTASSYQRGVGYLLSTQFEDGSWYVQTRSRPVQPHFDSHFPFGYDQWISAAGTAVASTGLALALEPKGSPVTRPLDLTPKATAPEEEFVFKGVRTIQFDRDIRPILLESCIDCHDAETKKGNFAMTDRHSFLEGGWGRLPVVPGRGADSQLIRHVTDQIEDMEMPPLSKRKSYPKLTQADVQKLVTWIDEGVEWPSNLKLE